MRDGIRLFTAIYSPRDSSVKYPIMLVKTPYGIRPYGEENYPESIGPSEYFAKEKYIFVYQDARGMFMSEGEFRQMTPHITVKPDSTFTDNSSDTYDAVEWLLKKTNNNGKVGLWGISYRGFYASSGIINAHPAIKCSSPQAAIADWFIGDDVHHNGEFSLLVNFLFFEIVAQKRQGVFTEWPPVKEYSSRDAYNFFLNIGKLNEVNDKYFNDNVPFWDSLILHPDYDYFWQERNILPHLKNIKPAVLVVGGLFDHENLYGSLQTYQAIENSSGAENRLVLGPWIHGGWARTEGDSLGSVGFGSKTSDFYQKQIELPFFNYYLKRKGNLDTLPKVMVFSTGTNKWNSFSEWPPENVIEKQLYFNQNRSLSDTLPKQSGFIYDEYISDPHHPVPYTQTFHPLRLFYNKEYMIEDQRFASSRADVLSYQTHTLEDTITMTGDINAKLFVASTSSDYDLVVKIIDIYPDRISMDYYDNAEVDMAGYQQLVRTEIFRVKYRNSFEDPEPVLPKKIEEVNIPLNDICHSFLPGHRIMVQVQSSLFPLYDRNPQKFMNIYEAEEQDFQKANIMIYVSRDYPSGITFKQISQ